MPNIFRFMTDVSRTYRRRYLKSIMCYQEDIGRTKHRRRMLDANLCENDPSTYFYCYCGLVYCCGCVALGQRISESDRTNPAALCVRARSAHRTQTVREFIGLPGRFISSALARIRYRDFW